MALDMDKFMKLVKEKAAMSEEERKADWKRAVKEDPSLAHVGCPSYPDCSIAPGGCTVVMGVDDVEWYGHKD